MKKYQFSIYNQFKIIISDRQFPKKWWTTLMISILQFLTWRLAARYHLPGAGSSTICITPPPTSPGVPDISLYTCDPWQTGKLGSTLSLRLFHLRFPMNPFSKDWYFLLRKALWGPPATFQKQFPFFWNIVLFPFFWGYCIIGPKKHC